MRFENVMIESVAYELATETITSADIEEQISGTLERIGVGRGMLETVSGVTERRFWKPGTQPSEVATIAAHKAIEIAGIDPGNIGCLISTSVMKDYIEPSVACLIHGNLKLPASCINYDIGNACLGFVTGMVNVATMIDARIVDHALVVAGEANRALLTATIERLKSPAAGTSDLMANLATLTMGEGAVAMILSHQDVSKSGHKIKEAISLAATEHSRLCVAKDDFLYAIPRRLMIAGVALMTDTWMLAEKTFEDWKDENIDLYVPHQVSSHNTDAVIRAIGATKEKFKLTFPTLGNTGSAGLPMALALAAEEKRIQAGSRVCLMGIGSGLNSAVMSIDW